MRHRSFSPHPPPLVDVGKVLKIQKKIADLFFFLSEAKERCENKLHHQVIRRNRGRKDEGDEEEQKQEGEQQQSDAWTM